MIANAKRNIQHGFTIIELIIVIAVIAILATIVIVAYNGVQTGAKDASLLSDIDTLDGLETQCGLNKTACGIASTDAAKAWYSASGVDNYLNFSPSSGNIIDVVVNGTDYCIRAYNPNSASYKTLATAAKRESTLGVCASLNASTLARADSPTGNGGVVTTLAGSTFGYADGVGASAQFGFALGCALNSGGDLYVADPSNTLIRKVTSGGVVTTFAGSTNGYSDGTGSGAQFDFPEAITVDGSGNLYLTDYNRVRKITSGAVVTTLAGSTIAGYTDASGSSAQFDNLKGIAVDGSGNVYVADAGNDRIRKITSGGVVTTFAGSSDGYIDATGLSAQFSDLRGMAMDASSNLYVTDGHRIRKITPGGVVTTLAGSTWGYIDATGTSARFNQPSGLTVDSSGNLYASDYGNDRIRKITPGGVVTTLAGSSGGYTDGTGSGAQFSQPNGITVNSSDVIYVVDSGNNRIRLIQ